MARLIAIVFLLVNLLPGLWAQQSNGTLQGNVTEKDEEGNMQPLVGANVYWMGTAKGTVTDEKGAFTLNRVAKTSSLVVSYIGYATDTIDVGGKNKISIQLSSSVELDEAKIAYRQKSTEISRLDPLKTETMGEKEFMKAACCNLSESFETNPSVDVSFTDAITGTRQIQMLGLAGPYTQITRENMPDVRGLSAIYGLTYIPGTWVESLQLNKGTGSVVNGFESIAGQINTELRKPETAERMYLNLYSNEGGRIEGNANFAHRFKQDRWSTGLLLHAKHNSLRWDKNHDSFMDHPIGNQFIGLNRWKYFGDDGLRLHFGIKGTYVDNTGGQVDFNAPDEILEENIWGMKMKTQRYEGWAKIGKVYEPMPWRSMALQLSGAVHQHNSNFGLNAYDAAQESFYANYIYQSILSNTNHKFKTGGSLQYDNYREVLNDTVFNHEEVVPGVYFEYTFTHLEKFSAVAGIRGDYHNLYGPFVTPRIHLRYAITGNSILRASGGRGQRTATIIAENSGLLASSRQVIIQGDGSDKPYGLNPEVAWNYGVNFSRHFRLDYRDGAISFDYYRTDFENQVVVDLDQSPQTAVIYNLDGKSYSSSFQAQLDYELIKRLDMRLAYRMYDVKTTYQGELKQKPLVATHRAFANLAYETYNQWKFDYTVNWQGEKRIPYTGSNPEVYQLPERAPAFVVINAQISKMWNENLEIYAGAENLLGYKQKNPIVASGEPFSPYFDSSMIWGPVFGRKIYIGLRYRI
ncbi:MAG: TonB-dependent receptor [Bacteroidota bacterium]